MEGLGKKVLKKFLTLKNYCHMKLGMTLLPPQGKNNQPLCDRFQSSSLLFKLVFNAKRILGIHRYQSYNLCNQNNTKGHAEKRCFFPHWFHAPTFTGSQSVEQDTNVNNVVGKIFLFLTDQSIQVKIFKMPGASCAILVCNSSTRKRGIVIFRVPT